MQLESWLLLLRTSTVHWLAELTTAHMRQHPQRSQRRGNGQPIGAPASGCATAAHISDFFFFVSTSYAALAPPPPPPPPRFPLYVLPLSIFQASSCPPSWEEKEIRHAIIKHFDGLEHMYAGASCVVCTSISLAEGGGLRQNGSNGAVTGGFGVGGKIGGWIDSSSCPALNLPSHRLHPLVWKFNDSFPFCSQPSLCTQLLRGILREEKERRATTDVPCNWQ
ncbi:hypothetical protein IWZ01DRAFT_65534 [Phyllosticta capitalensis]